jgi:hypothetical protein
MSSDNLNVLEGNVANVRKVGISSVGAIIQTFKIY